MPMLEMTDEQLGWLQLAVSHAIRLAQRERRDRHLYRFNELQTLILDQRLRGDERGLASPASKGE